MDFIGYDYSLSRGALCPALKMYVGTLFSTILRSLVRQKKKSENTKINCIRVKYHFVSQSYTQPWKKAHHNLSRSGWLSE